MKLEDKADDTVAKGCESVFTQRCNIDTINDNLAFCWHIERAENIEQRRFPASRLPNDGNKFSRADFNINAMQHRRLDLTEVGLLQAIGRYNNLLWRTVFCHRIHSQSHAPNALRRQDSSSQPAGRETMRL